VTVFGLDFRLGLYCPCCPASVLERLEPRLCRLKSVVLSAMKLGEGGAKSVSLTASLITGVRLPALASISTLVCSGNFVISIPFSSSSPDAL